MQKNTAVNYTDGRFKSVAEKCVGCDRITEQEGTQYCTTYVNPEAKWKLGLCNFATHVKPEIKVNTVRVNPLKAAKRASKG
ncbi:MAG: PxxKW family cysteine-rich protein [Desulfotalea sp.]